MSKAMLKRIEALESLINARGVCAHIIALPYDHDNLLVGEAWREEAISKGEIHDGDFCVMLGGDGALAFIGEPPNQNCQTVHHVLPGAERPPPPVPDDLPDMTGTPVPTESPTDFAQPVPLPEQPPLIGGQDKSQRITDFYDWYDGAW